MLHLMMGTYSEKWDVGWFCHCVKITECTYTDVDSIAYYTPGLYGIAYCFQATKPYDMHKIRQKSNQAQDKIMQSRDMINIWCTRLLLVKHGILF